VSEASVGRVARTCGIFAVVHSLFASKQAKDLVYQVAGRRYRNGTYRFAYVVQSIVLLGWASWHFKRLPDRDLYQVPSPWSWLVRAGQLASLMLIISTIRTLGTLRSTGIAPMHELLVGLDPVPEPEAQGPPLGDNNEMIVAGPFRFSRHPSNLGGLLFFLLFPRMTVNRMLLAGLVAVYIILGSLHEEYRLRAAYGMPYVRYQQRVPFLFPSLAWKWRAEIVGKTVEDKS
jgi:uncharacterized membrane protein